MGNDALKEVMDREKLRQLRTPTTSLIPRKVSRSLNVGSFMHDLFRQGAFQGKTPREAYLVKCDKETTTQSDIDHGIVNIVVGFAPLKPAEFVILKIQQLAGQIET